MLRYNRVLVLFMGLVVSLAAVSQGPTEDKRIEKLDAMMRSYHEQGLINGTVLLAEKGRVLYRQAFGLANVEWNIPNQVDTKYTLFSISKQFTAMLGMMMVAEGKLNLDSRLIDYLPWFRKDTGEKIRIRHLFSHSHGIPYVSYNRLPYRNKLDKIEFMKAHYFQDLAFEPGQGFEYGDGFDILAAVIEAVSKKPFEQLMKERILEPLQMADTGFWRARENIVRHAADYADSLNHKAEALYEMPLNGSCALHSTVDDLFKWYMALRGNVLIAQSFRDQMTRVQVDFGRPYGFGFDVADSFAGKTERKVVWHEGGASALFLWAIDEDRLVVLLNNVHGDNLRIGGEVLALFDN